MKKYTLFLFLLLFSFGLFFTNVSFVKAFDTENSGCQVGDMYSRTTGKVCGTPTFTECRTGDLFSSTTGKRCTVWQDNSSSQTKAVASLDTLFKRKLVVGSKGEDVKALQKILKDTGFLSGKVDGFYGPITKSAVTEYQKENSITETGKANLDTFEKIKVMPWFRLCPLINDTYGVYYPCPPIPTTQPPVISGVSGPQTLNINQTGTWTVKASSSNGGNLSYSVRWGDEMIYGVPMSSSFNIPTQQSATFTNSYSQAGIYKPTFTVTSENTIQCITTPCPSNVGLYIPACE